MMMKRRSKAIAFFVAIMMTIVQLVILPANGIEAKVTYVVDAVPSTLHIAERSPSEIRQFIASHPVQYLTTEYTEEPLITSPYAAGKVSEKNLTDALNRLNTYRFIAGLSADVKLDDEYNKLAQAASLINRVNGGLSHSPERPEGMSDELYQLARSGAGSCNLAMMGMSSTIARSIDMYVNEGGVLGHRRWVLNPPMKKTGFGIVGNVSAMYDFDNSFNNKDNLESVWPSLNTPVEFFSKNSYWMISMGYEVDISTITVKATNRKTGKSCTLTKNDSSYLTVDNIHYGLRGCIIFRPQIDFECEVGDSVNVEITGLPKGDVSYTVNFFSCEPTKLVTSGIYCAQSSPSIVAGMVIDNKDKIIEPIEYKWIACEESNQQWFEVSPWTEENEWLTWSPEESGNYIVMCYARVKNDLETEVSASFGTPYISTHKKISKATIASIPDVTYTGSAVKPFVSVKYGNTVLKNGTDYELSFSNNVKVGTASVKITGKGLYTGTVTKSFKIVKDETSNADISYRTYVQSYGWQPFVKDGSVSGTYAQAKRLEGIQIKLSKKDYAGGVKYKTYVQSYGWQSWASNGGASGTMGQSKRLEAIQIKLTGDMSKQYDVYYRVQAQKLGWMGWSKNGASAGTAGFGYRLEGIQIKLVKKGDKAPTSSKVAYQKKQS